MLSLLPRIIKFVIAVYIFNLVTSNLLHFNRNCGEFGINANRQKNKTGMVIITNGTVLYSKIVPAMKPARVPE